MKFSVAPESTRVRASALFDLVCIKKRTVIDFLLDIYTSEVWVCLISADLIKQGKILVFSHHLDQGVILGWGECVDLGFK
jgi:hypothetical protein